MLLSDIRLIDLRFSDLDKASSDPEKGIYVFNHAETVSYKDAGRRPDWFFCWTRYDPDNKYREYRDKRNMGWTAVINGQDDFVALGADVNAEGMFQCGDVILMKRRLMDQLLEAERNVNIAKNQAKNRIKAFKDEMKAEGAGVPESMIDDFVSSYLG